MKEFIKEMRCVSGSKSVLNFGEIPYGDKQVMRLQADMEELVKDIGIILRIDFCDGIRKLFNWVDNIT